MNTSVYRIITNNGIIDNRDLENSKEQKIKDFRSQTQYNILVVEELDELTQINASLGVYDSIRTEEIKLKIQYWRNKFLEAKNKILNAQTLEELDQINL
jgi:hypothetical protein